jgi:hypothetical protein
MENISKSAFAVCPRCLMSGKVSPLYFVEGAAGECNIHGIMDQQTIDQYTAESRTDPTALRTIERSRERQG